MLDPDSLTPEQLALLENLTPEQLALIEKNQSERPVRELTELQALAQRVAGLNESNAREFYTELLGGAPTDYTDEAVWAVTSSNRNEDVCDQVYSYSDRLAKQRIQCPVSSPGYRNSIYSARENLRQQMPR